jgi:hypothetical protein
VLVDVDAIRDERRAAVQDRRETPARAEPEVVTFGAMREKFTDSEPCAKPVKVTSSARAWPTRASVQANARELGRTSLMAGFRRARQVLTQRARL